MTEGLVEDRHGPREQGWLEPRPAAQGWESGLDHLLVSMETSMREEFPLPVVLGSCNGLSFIRAGIPLM